MKTLFVSLWRRLPVPLRRTLIRFVVPTYTVGVLGVVRDDRERVLLLRHRMREDDGWELPGGFVDKGESLYEALRRELREETGLDVQVIKVVRASIPRPGHVEIVFLTRALACDLLIDDREVLQARWFDSTDLPRITSPHQAADIDSLGTKVRREL
ncbi:MAG: NUDIX hydrolase [Chloroflexota bacterium]